MTDARAAAVVLAAAPRPGRCKTRLEPLLGPDGCAALQAVLIRRAAAWAAEVGTPYVAFGPADARDEVAELAPGARLIELAGDDPVARVAAAADAVLAEHGGPVLLVGVDTPQIRPQVGRQALEDLAAGCDLTFGPSADGRFYLVGLREPHPEVFALPEGAWQGPRVLELALTAAHEAGLDLAMLRGERALHEEGDARAVLADPCAPDDVAEVLRAWADR